MDTLDVRGLSCPEPVLKVQNYIQVHKVGKFTVLLDSPTAYDNVCALLNKKGYTLDTKETEGEYKLTAEK